MSKKRVKFHDAGGKRDLAVKDASKKKRKLDSRTIKFRNAALKANLDSQAHILYQSDTKTNTASIPLPLPEPNVHDLAVVLTSL